MKKVLIVVDVQNDFCPGGSLAVSDGNNIVPIINQLSNSGKFDLIIATQDWHPENHVSFASKYGVDPFSIIGDNTVWPDHCIQNTKGAELNPDLDTTNFNFILRKGMNIDIDSYSAFVDNDKINITYLVNLLSPKDEVYVVGIATEVCVFNTLITAPKCVELFMIKDACANLDNNMINHIYDNLRFEGVKIITSKEILGE